MKRKITFIIVVLAFGMMNKSLAQDTLNPVLTADSLSGGNYKDVFKSFFQLAFDRFTSNNKEIQFTSNPFAIMAKANPNLLVDTNYLRYKVLRNLNFSFSAKLDSSYKFNGFASGITYAIVNQRDETVSRYFLRQAYAANDEFNKMLPMLTAYVTTLPAQQRQGINLQIDSFFAGTKNFKSLDAALKSEIRKVAATVNADYFLELLAKDGDLNLGDLMRENYAKVRESFQNRLLWTVGVSDTTYNNQFMFSNITLSTNIVKGIVNPKSVCGLELNLKGTYQFVADTLQQGKNLQRKVLRVEPGVNLVFKTKRTHYPWAEFKLSGEYIHINKPYIDEHMDNLNINGTLRIRVIDDIWIPLEIKYDPRNGNFFGFLDVHANFKAIKQLISK